MKPILEQLLAQHRIEYLEIDRYLAIAGFSSGVGTYSEFSHKVALGEDIRLSFPELIGAEQTLYNILAGKQSSFEIRGIRRGKCEQTSTYIDLRVFADRAQGNPQALVVSIEDVTERMQLEQTLVQRTNDTTLLYQALTTAKEDLDKMIKSMADALLVTDEQGTIKTINQATKELFGYAEGELLDRPIDWIVPDGDRAQQIRDRALHSAGEFWEVTCRKKNGEELIVSLSCAAIQGRLTQSQDFVYIARDVTARKRAEQELEYARRQAELASQAKSSFLANMSHEIRTPLNAVLGMAGLLAETELTPEQQDLVETIRVSGDALLSLINEILDLSKLEAGEMVLDEEDFQLSTCMEEAVELLAPTASEKRLEIAALCNPEVPDFVRGDRDRLRQILMNLVGNAVKFTEQGSVTVRSELVSQTDTAVTVCLHVSDTGIGISPENCEKLFQPFSQVYSQSTRKYGGTGLGLAICQQLAQLMDGNIQVNSELGRGSTFSVTIPFPKSTSPAVRVPTNWQGYRFLVADASAISREAIQYQLQFWGIKTTAVRSSTEVVAALQQAENRGTPYHGLCLDVGLPPYGGWNCMQQIEQSCGNPPIPTVVLSSIHQRQQARQLQETGLAAVAVKPVKREKLQEILTQILPSGKMEAVGKQPTGESTASDRFWFAKEAAKSKLRILVAEDNAVNRKVACKQLETLGYTADVATNGEEVLQRLEAQTYDIIFMDCQMPVLDGYATTERLRQQWQDQQTDILYPVVIAMTANAMSEDREKCLNAGMNDYISKPVRKARLQEILSHWCQKLEMACLNSSEETHTQM
jgi:PAS domain S-box-containing protein